MKLLYLERFEGPLGLCEDENGTRVSLPRTALSADVREGDVLKSKEGEWRPDRKATAAKKEALLRRTRRLSKK